MKKIPLTQNKFALVDDEDFEYFRQWKWHSVRGYAVRTVHIRGGKGKKLRVYLHKEVNNTPEGYLTDHINRDPLDNRKNNLRSVTRSQNRLNSNLSKNNACGLNGVCWDKDTESYRVRITINGKRISLGRYKSFQGAYLARKWGERVYL